ncbi:hypothetical protein JNW89_24375, partial [Micromonospora sp. 4G55]|nr:hypothetical protein [Micromonospora sp. 4G55]
MAARRAGRRPDPNEEAFRQARQRVTTHPMFRPLCSAGAARNAWFAWSDDDELADQRGWARVREDGKVVVNRRRRADADEWYWVLVHCLLHLGFGHLDPEREDPADRAEQAAACLVVARFQHDAKLGRPPGRTATPAARRGRGPARRPVAGERRSRRVRDCGRRRVVLGAGALPAAPRLRSPRPRAGGPGRPGR